jgi:hypothetical protein
MTSADVEVRTHDERVADFLTVTPDVFATLSDESRATMMFTLLQEAVLSNYRVMRRIEGIEEEAKSMFDADKMQSMMTQFLGGGFGGL